MVDKSVTLANNQTPSPDKPVQGTSKPSQVSDKPIHVTDAEFDQVVKEHPYVIGEFWGEWCAPCRASAPLIDEVPKIYAGPVPFVKGDTEKNTNVPRRFMVMGLPTLLFFKEGRLVD